MPRPEFTWFPDVGSQCATKPAVDVTKFGDGYELRTSNGLNTMPEKWSVKFTRHISEIAQIEAFLRARAGKEAFTWRTPENIEGTYVCREWRKNRLNGEVVEISGDFEQVFEF